MADDKKTYAVPKESHAREFLASERTFLAWIRTSIAVIGFGFAVIKFDVWIRELAKTSGVQPQPRLHLTIPIGGLMVIVGGLLAIFGAWHYRITNKQVERGEVKANNWLIFAVSGLMILLSVFIIIYLILSGEFF